MLKLYRFFSLVVFVVMAVCMAAILVVGIRHPANHLISWQMAVGIFVGTVLVLVLVLLWEKWVLARPFQVLGGKLYPVLLLGYGSFIYLLSFFHRNSPGSFVDYSVVYNAAMQLAESGEITDAGYFLIYPNNFKLALYLGALFRAAIAVGFEDPYYFVLAIGVVQVLAAVWATDYLLRSVPRYEIYRIPLFAGYMFMLPIYANTQAFYTDQMSFWQAVCALACFLYAHRHCGDRKIFSVALAGFAGGLCAFGYTVKATALIPVIAAVIVYILVYLPSGEKEKKPRPMLWAAFVIFFALTMLFTEKWANQYDVYRQSANTANPVSSWVAIGLVGDGSFGEDIEYSHTLNAMESKAEKKVYTSQYIREHSANFLDPTHFLAKLNCNFGDGSLGTKDYTYYALYPGNLIYELYAPWGKYYWRTQQICFVYLFVLYVSYFLGAVSGIILWAGKKEIPAQLLFVQLSFLGNIMFLMLWEANNRQLYNQVPILVLGWIINLVLIRKTLLKHVK